MEFSWEARSKSDCPPMVRSRVLFLLQGHTRGKSDDSREEVIIRYEPSRHERVAVVTKNERRRERRRENWKRNGSKKNRTKNEDGEVEGKKAMGGKEGAEEPSTSLSPLF